MMMNTVEFAAANFANDLSELRAEKSRLQAELAVVDKRLIDLEVTERVLKSYGLGVAEVAQETAPPARAIALRQFSKSITKREQILTVAAELLKIGPVQTEALLDALDQRGISVSGDDRKAQIRNLSSYLSRAQTELGISATRAGWATAAQKGEAPEGL